MAKGEPDVKRSRQRAAGGPCRVSAPRHRRTRAELAAALAAVMLLLLGPRVLAGAQTVPPTSPTSSSSTTTSTSAPDTTTSSTAPPTSEPTTQPSTPSTSTTAPPGGSSPTTQPSGDTTGVLPGTPDPNDPNAINNLVQGNDELSKDELDLLQSFLDAQGEVNSVTDELTKINDQFLASQRDMLDAINRVSDADNKLKATNDQLGKAQDSLGQEQKQLQAEAVGAYMGGGDEMSSVKAMLNAETVGDLAKTQEYASAVADDQQTVIDDYRNLKQQVDDLRRQADQEHSDSVKARNDLVARQNALDQQRNDLLAARDKKLSTAEDKVKLLAEVEAKRPDFLAQLTEHQHSGDDVASRLRTLQAGEQLPDDTSDYFLQPLEHYTLTQTYGNHGNPLYGTSSFHPGIDMAAPAGTPIHAAGDGVVIMAEWFDGYGNCTVIDHGNGLATLYGHQTAFAVKEGDHVARDQIIGYVGTTGYSTGPHLHWEVREFGDTTDPIPFMQPR
jgi:murein DD-endopeptidase MepM/ murein hydrolase activator NlpD